MANLISLLPMNRGYICICLPSERLEALEIGMMVADNQDRNKTAYTVTVDYKHGTLDSFFPFILIILL